MFGFYMKRIALYWNSVKFDGCHLKPMTHVYVVLQCMSSQ